MNMAATIDAPAKCELRIVIRFLGPKRSVVGGLYAAGDNNNKGSLL